MLSYLAFVYDKVGVDEVISPLTSFNVNLGVSDCFLMKLPI